MRGSVLLTATLCGTAALALGGYGAGSASSNIEFDQSAATAAYAGDDAVGPLDKYLNILYALNEQTEESFYQQHKQIEEAIAACMAEEGFDYIPQLNNISWSDGDELQPDSPEFIDQYGYGIVNSPAQEEAEAAPPEPANPNYEYYETLSESEQGAYSTALAGIDSTDNPEEEVYDPAHHGCKGKAEAEFTVEPGYYEDPDFSDLFAGIDGIWESTRPQREAIEAEWSTCMSDAGFPGLTEKLTAWVALQQQYADLMNSEPNGPTKEQIDAFQANEIKQAQTAEDCAAEVKYYEISQQISFTAQDKFVVTHKDKLEALVAKYGNQ